MPAPKVHMAFSAPVKWKVYSPLRLWTIILRESKFPDFRGQPSYVRCSAPYAFCMRDMCHQVESHSWTTLFEAENPTVEALKTGQERGQSSICGMLTFSQQVSLAFLMMYWPWLWFGAIFCEARRVG